MQPTDRGRQIMQMLLQMEKQFGKGSVLQLGSRNALPVTVISSGSKGFPIKSCPPGSADPERHSKS